MSDPVDNPREAVLDAVSVMAKHALIPGPDPYPRCSCGKDFAGESEWRLHVGDALLDSLPAAGWVHSSQLEQARNGYATYSIERVPDSIREDWWPAGAWVVVHDQGFDGWGRIVACCINQSDAYVVLAALRVVSGSVGVSGEETQ